METFDLEAITIESELRALLSECEECDNEDSMRHLIDELFRSADQASHIEISRVFLRELCVFMFMSKKRAQTSTPHATESTEKSIHHSHHLHVDLRPHDAGYAGRLSPSLTPGEGRAGRSSPVINHRDKERDERLTTFYPQSRLGTVPFPTAADVDLEGVMDDSDTGSDVPSQSSESSLDMKEAEFGQSFDPSPSSSMWRNALSVPNNSSSSSRHSSGAEDTPTHHDLFSTLVDVAGSRLHGGSGVQHSPKSPADNRSFHSTAQGDGEGRDGDSDGDSGSGGDGDVDSRQQRLLEAEVEGDADFDSELNDYGVTYLDCEDEDVDDEEYVNTLAQGLTHGYYPTKSAPVSVLGLSEQIELAVRSVVSASLESDVYASTTSPVKANCRVPTFSSIVLDQISRAVTTHLGFEGSKAEKIEQMSRRVINMFVGAEISVDNTNVMVQVIGSVLERTLVTMDGDDDNFGVDEDGTGELDEEDEVDEDEDRDDDNEEDEEEEEEDDEGEDVPCSSTDSLADVESVGEFSVDQEEDEDDDVRDDAGFEIEIDPSKLKDDVSTATVASRESVGDFSVDNDDDNDGDSDGDSDGNEQLDAQGVRQRPYQTPTAAAATTATAAATATVTRHQGIVNSNGVCVSGAMNDSGDSGEEEEFDSSALPQFSNRAVMTFTMKDFESEEGHVGEKEIDLSDLPLFIRHEGPRVNVKSSDLIFDDFSPSEDESDNGSSDHSSSSSSEASDVGGTYFPPAMQLSPSTSILYPPSSMPSSSSPEHDKKVDTGRDGVTAEERGVRGGGGGGVSRDEMVNLMGQFKNLVSTANLSGENKSRQSALFDLMPTTSLADTAMTHGSSTGSPDSTENRAAAAAHIQPAVGGGRGGGLQMLQRPLSASIYGRHQSFNDQNIQLTISSDLKTLLEDDEFEVLDVDGEVDAAAPPLAPAPAAAPALAAAPAPAESDNMLFGSAVHELLDESSEDHILPSNHPVHGAAFNSSTVSPSFPFTRNMTLNQMLSQSFKDHLEKYSTTSPPSPPPSSSSSSSSCPPSSVSSTAVFVPSEGFDRPLSRRGEGRSGSRVNANSGLGVSDLTGRTNLVHTWLPQQDDNLLLSSERLKSLNIGDFGVEDWSEDEEDDKSAGGGHDGFDGTDFQKYIVDNGEAAGNAGGDLIEVDVNDEDEEEEEEEEGIEWQSDFLDTPLPPSQDRSVVSNWTTDAPSVSTVTAGRRPVSPSSPQPLCNPPSSTVFISERGDGENNESKTSSEKKKSHKKKKGRKVKKVSSESSRGLSSSVVVALSPTAIAPESYTETLAKREALKTLTAGRRKSKSHSESAASGLSGLSGMSGLSGLSGLGTSSGNLPSTPNSSTPRQRAARGVSPRTSDSILSDQLREPTLTESTDSLKAKIRFARSVSSANVTASILEGLGAATATLSASSPSTTRRTKVKSARRPTSAPSIVYTNSTLYAPTVSSLNHSVSISQDSMAALSDRRRRDQDLSDQINQSQSYSPLKTSKKTRSVASASNGNSGGGGGGGAMSSSSSSTKVRKT